MNHILPQIKIYSDIKFKGVLQRVDKERKIHPVKPTNIENAHEIYIDANYIDTIHVKPQLKRRWKSKINMPSPEERKDQEDQNGD